MPLPFALFVVLLALNLGSGRADETTDAPAPTPAPESASDSGDARQATPNLFDEIGKDCPPTTCTTPLTCYKSKCDCEMPTDTSDCSCDLGGGHVYRRWEKDSKDGGACKLAYGESPCESPGQGQKYNECGPGLKCENNFCKTSATSITSPYSVGALVISALIMTILK